MQVNFHKLDMLSGSSFLGVPVAGATLPVLAFLLLGIYGKLIWMIISVVILGIGHIGIHLAHRKEVKFFMPNCRWHKGNSARKVFASDLLIMPSA